MARPGVEPVGKMRSAGAGPAAERFRIIPRMTPPVLEYHTPDPAPSWSPPRAWRGGLARGIVKIGVAVAFPSVCVLGGLYDTWGPRPTGRRGLPNPEWRRNHGGMTARCGG